METQTPQRAELSFRPEDFAADIAKLAAEANPNPVVEAPKVIADTQMPVQPTPIQAPATVTPEPPANQAPAPAPQAVAVPEKFKAPDGTLDTAKLEKSTADADKALLTYLAKEKELKRKMNEVRQAENAYLNPANIPAPIPGIAPAPNPALTFEQQLEADAQSKGFGVVAARLFTAAQEAAVEQMRKELNPLRQGFEEAATTRQLEAIGKSDPWVYTPEGVGALTQILTDQPYLWQAPDPYKAAYMFSGRSVIARSSPQVLTPTPTAKATAPVPSAVAANMTPQAPSIRLDSKEAIDAHMKTLTTAQQEEFFVKMGFPRFDAR